MYSSGSLSRTLVRMLLFLVAGCPYCISVMGFWESCSTEKYKYEFTHFQEITHFTEKDENESGKDLSTWDTIYFLV